MTVPNGTPVNIPQLAERLDQKIEDLKDSVESRFVQHEQYEGAQALTLATGAVARDTALHLLLQEWRTADKLLLQEWRTADKRLLDERFDTQTTTLNAAFAAAEQARQEARDTTKTATEATDKRIKDVEDRLNATGGRSLGRTDVFGWVVAAVAVVLAVIQFVNK